MYVGLTRGNKVYKKHTLFTIHNVQLTLLAVTVTIETCADALNISRRYDIVLFQNLIGYCQRFLLCCHQTLARAGSGFETSPYGPGILPLYVEKEKAGFHIPPLDLKYPLRNFPGSLPMIMLHFALHGHTVYITPPPSILKTY